MSVLVNVIQVLHGYVMKRVKARRLATAKRSRASSRVKKIWPGQVA